MKILVKSFFLNSNFLFKKLLMADSTKLVVIKVIIIIEVDSTKVVSGSQNSYSVSIVFLGHLHVPTSI